MKRINPRRAKLHRSYTAFELADLLGLHENSVRQWIKQGLPVVDGARPALISGSEFQSWWGKRRKDAKRPCQPGQTFCFKCREPKAPALGMVEFVATIGLTGNLKALCETCGTMMNLRTRLDNLPNRMTSYGKVPASRQAQLIRGLGQGSWLDDDARIAAIVVEALHRSQLSKLGIQRS